MHVYYKNWKVKISRMLCCFLFTATTTINICQAHAKSPQGCIHISVLLSAMSSSPLTTWPLHPYPLALALAPLKSLSCPIPPRLPLPLGAELEVLGVFPQSTEHNHTENLVLQLTYLVLHPDQLKMSENHLLKVSFIKF